MLAHGVGAGGRELHEPGPPVLGALAALEQVAPHESVDGARGGRQREAERLAELLDGELLAVHQRVQRLQLRERQLQLVDGAEEVVR